MAPRRIRGTSPLAQALLEAGRGTESEFASVCGLAAEMTWGADNVPGSNPGKPDSELLLRPLRVWMTTFRRYGR